MLHARQAEEKRPAGTHVGACARITNARPSVLLLVDPEALIVAPLAYVDAQKSKTWRMPDFEACCTQGKQKKRDVQVRIG
jgi:hypothetical protein